MPCSWLRCAQLPLRCAEKKSTTSALTVNERHDAWRRARTGYQLHTALAVLSVDEDSSEVAHELGKFGRVIYFDNRCWAVILLDGLDIGKHCDEVWIHCEMTLRG